MISLIILIAISTSLHAQIPEPVSILMKYYPQIVKYENNRVYCKNGESFLYDDRKKKSPQELLDNPNIIAVLYLHRLSDIMILEELDMKDYSKRSMDQQRMLSQRT
jgi:hypothetical protein